MTPGTFREALANLRLHKARSTLAILGIVFGVASVICMLSISEVARRDAVARIERMGLRNVILDSVKPEKVRTREGKDEEGGAGTPRYGLTRADLSLLAETLPGVEAIAPLRVLWQGVKAGVRKSDVAVIGTVSSYPGVLEHPVRRGRFIVPVDELTAQTVCVLGDEAARALFPLADPLDRVVTVGKVPFRVVGVMARKGSTSLDEALGNPDNALYIPLSTAFARFGAFQIKMGIGSGETSNLEVNRAVLRLSEPGLLAPTAQAARRLLETRHRAKDVQATIPHALMTEHRRTEGIFRWVMGSLTAISLLVGGIGIMNIMLANVAERRAEVGLRRALGATRGDVVRLFLSESTLLCVLGGILGLALGVGLAFFVGKLAGWTVAFEPLAFPLGLGVAVAAGLLFGTVPARRAARLDPVRALRSE